VARRRFETKTTWLVSLFGRDESTGSARATAVFSFFRSCSFVLVETQPRSRGSTKTVTHHALHIIHHAKFPPYTSHPSNVLDTND
jgi:hypothetical protein